MKKILIWIIILICYFNLTKEIQAMVVSNSSDKPIDIVVHHATRGKGDNYLRIYSLSTGGYASVKLNGIGPFVLIIYLNAKLIVQANDVRNSDKFLFDGKKLIEWDGKKRKIVMKHKK